MQAWDVYILLDISLLTGSKALWIILMTVATQGKCLSKSSATLFLKISLPPLESLTQTLYFPSISFLIMAWIQMEKGNVYQHNVTSQPVRLQHTAINAGQGYINIAQPWTCISRFKASFKCTMGTRTYISQKYTACTNYIIITIAITIKAVGGYCYSMSSWL